MADKRLRLIVEAVTSQAQAALRSFSNTIRGTSDQAARDLEKPTKAAENMGAQLGTLAATAGIFLAGIATHYAKMAASAIVSMAEMAAKNLELGEGFRTVAGRMGIDANELVQRLQEAARGTIGAYQTMGLAIKALDLGIAASTDDLVKLMEIAHVRAKRYGMSTAEAYEMLINGIASGRPMMLKNLGFLADTEKAYDAVARSMGRDADELTLLQQKQAIYQAILQTGQPDIEAWVDTADDATDVFARNEVATAKLRQELGERFLPAVVAVKEAMTDLMTVMVKMEDPLAREREVFAGLIQEHGTMRGATLAFAENIEVASGGLIDHAQALDLAKEATTRYTNATEAAKWGQMYQDSARARMAIQEVGDTADETSADMEELADSFKKAIDVWGDYTRNVTQENWQFARRVADAQFQATQAAENAAFDLWKIQRDAADRSSDLLADMAIREEAQTAEHYASLRRMREDLNDALTDMEWDYQRERQEAMDKAPWFVRYALQAEFAERERIAKTGDKEALAQYDQTLMARIKAIDPAYAKELEALEELHEHEEDIETREGRQSLQRQKEDWQISQREQSRALGQQLYELERNLGYQLDEWHFHQGQREESERHSMDNLIAEHSNSLSKLYSDTMRKLGDLTPLWDYYGKEYGMAMISGLKSAQLPDLFKDQGYTAWLQFLKGVGDAQSDYGFCPMPGGNYNPFEGGNPWASAQRGMEYVPRTMPVMVHKGESILPAPAAQQYREMGPVTINVNVGGGYSPYQGQQIAAVVSDELGRAIRRNAR